jgi:hypothetical protein
MIHVHMRTNVNDRWQVFDSFRPKNGHIDTSTRECDCWKELLFDRFKMISEQQVNLQAMLIFCLLTIISLVISSIYSCLFTLLQLENYRSITMQLIDVVQNKSHKSLPYYLEFHRYRFELINEIILKFFFY